MNAVSQVRAKFDRNLSNSVHRSCNSVRTSGSRPIHREELPMYQERSLRPLEFGDSSIYEQMIDSIGILLECVRGQQCEDRRRTWIYSLRDLWFICFEILGSRPHFQSKGLGKERMCKLGKVKNEP